MIKNIKGFFTDNLKELATVLGVFGATFGFYGGLMLASKYERESDPALLRCFVYDLAKYDGSAAVRGFDNNNDGKIDRITAEWHEFGDVNHRLSKEYVPGDVDFASLEKGLLERGQLKGTRGNRILGYMGKEGF